jgi:ferric-dicitrate binding protein FerR (iron transport regulator)
VEVSLADESKNIPATRLEVNQHMTFNKTKGDISVITEDPYKYISWKEGKLVFRNEPLINVVNEISKVFNIDIELRGNEIKDYSYRATFQDESLEEILKLLKLSSPIDYIEETRTPLPDGSFPRKRVVIFPAKQKK